MPRIKDSVCCFFEPKRGGVIITLTSNAVCQAGTYDERCRRVTSIGGFFKPSECALQIRRPKRVL